MHKLRIDGTNLVQHREVIWKNFNKNCSIVVNISVVRANGYVNSNNYAGTIFIAAKLYARVHSGSSR